MKRDDLERYLERGNQLGFIKQTDDDNFLGWILLDKQKPNERYEKLLSAGEETKFVAQQEMVRRKPYRLAVLELRRDVHESSKYETNEDYKINQRHNFATLDEVEQFLQQYSHTLESIKWRAELNAP